MDRTESTLWAVGIIGAVIGLGQLLASGDRITPRAALGQAILSTGIALSAFTVLAWIPDASQPLLVGVSALLANLGSSGLTMLAQRIFKSRITISNDDESQVG